MRVAQLYKSLEGKSSDPPYSSGTSKMEDRFLEKEYHQGEVEKEKFRKTYPFPEDISKDVNMSDYPVYKALNEFPALYPSTPGGQEDQRDLRDLYRQLNDMEQQDDSPEREYDYDLSREGMRLV